MSLSMTKRYAEEEKNEAEAEFVTMLLDLARQKKHPMIQRTEEDRRYYCTIKAIKHFAQRTFERYDHEEKLKWLREFLPQWERKYP